MTRRKDPAVEAAVDLFMWQVGRYDNIRSEERKPTHGDRMWRGGYRAAMQDIVQVVGETLDRCDESCMPGRLAVAEVIRTVLAVALAANEADQVEDLLTG